MAFPPLHPRSRPGGRSLARGLALGLGCLWMIAGCTPTAYDLGTRALRDGEPEQAIDHFDTALDLGEDRFEALRERGAAQLEAGRPEAALSDLEAARALQDDDARLYWLLGRTNSALARYDDASEAYRRYQMLVSSRSIRRLAGIRQAQLRQEAARATADQLAEARQLGIPPAPNTVALYAFRPYDQQDPAAEDLKICRALSVWVIADLAKVESLRPVDAEALELLYEAQGLNIENRWQLDPASLVSAGNLQPARHMVRGEYGTVDEDHAVMLGVLFDAEAQATRDCPVQEDELAQLFDMETRFVLDLLDLMGIEPTPEERLAIGEKPTRNRLAFLAFADGLYRLWDLGDLEGARTSFEQASSLDPGFTMATEAAVSAEVMQAPAQVTVVPAPTVVKTTTERALVSAADLGLGLLPEDEAGEGAEVATQNVTAARGAATVRIRVEIRP